MRLIIYAALLLLPMVGQSDEKSRTFMFVGEPSAAAWQVMMDSPVDRREVVEEAFKALGGEMLSYYFGLGNGKNYITINLPNDNEVIQAIYLMRMPTGLLNAYEIIELMSSGEMVGALKKSNEFLEIEKTMIEREEQ